MGKRTPPAVQIVQQDAKLKEKLMYMRVLSTLAALTMTATVALAGQLGNPPWYPSLQAFEHYDSGRSHVFAKATFGGSFNRPNRVYLVPSNKAAYPSGYNTSYLNPQ